MSILKKIALIGVLPIILNVKDDNKPINLLTHQPLLNTRVNKDKKEQEKKKSSKDDKKKDSDDDNNNGGGGLLEPIIEDLQRWIKEKKPAPQP